MKILLLQTANKKNPIYKQPYLNAAYMCLDSQKACLSVRMCKSENVGTYTYMGIFLALCIAKARKSGV